MDWEPLIQAQVLGDGVTVVVARVVVVVRRSVAVVVTNSD